MEAGWSARRVARQLGRSDCVVTSGSERYHLHENQAQDALDRPVVEKTATSSDDNRVWRPLGERLNPAFALQRHTAPTAGVMVWGCPCLQYTVTPSIDSWHHDSPTQGYHKTGSTLLLPFLGLPIPRFVSNRAYLESFGMASWASHQFERTRGKVTANMKRNVSRHHIELLCLNARSYRIVHSR
ncbi:transposable element Tcb1 transposase [Trichonephila clavipes]|nr:transposable element Tcb1 transposase [Trichonephila clavipes]